MNAFDWLVVAFAVFGVVAALWLLSSILVHTGRPRPRQRVSGGYQPLSDGKPPGLPPSGGSGMKPPPCMCRRCRKARGECVG